MNRDRSKLFTRRAVFAALVGLVSLMGSSIQAQQPEKPGMSDRERRMLDRELNITLLERGARATGKREPQLLLKQINDDFARIQLVANEIKLQTSTSLPRDFDYISNAVSEIRKRSKRLRANLIFPEASRNEKREKFRAVTETGLQSSLLILDRLIRSFVTNPVFRNADVIDAKLAGKARGDLDDIIVLSDKIKEYAKKLNRTTKL